MKSNIIYKNFLLKEKLDGKSKNKLKVSFIKYLNEISNKIEDKENFYHFLSKKFKLNINDKDLRKFKKFKNISIIGMGGSILGSEAAYCFLRSKVKKNIYFFNDINENKIREFKRKIHPGKTLFIIISKSGNTIETLSNLIFLKIIKKGAKNIIIITEKNNQTLFKLTKQYNLPYVEHRKYIGGRFSFLSEVGLVPFYLMGLNIKNLKKSLLSFFNKKKNHFLQDSSIIMASMLNKNLYRNMILFNYIPELDKFQSWYQQILSESLGKKGKGFLPLVSTAPKDHHSLLQLYLDGPKDKIFNIFSLHNNSRGKKSSKSSPIHLDLIKNKNLYEIKNAQKEGFIEVLKKKNIPYREFILKELNEETLGELFSYFIVETILVGKLANLNPFNQPAVEQVKIETKRKLN